MKRIAFFLVVLVSCSTRAPSNEIFVVLTPEELMLEHQHIPKEYFEKQLAVLIEEKLRIGIKKDELTINLQVDEQTRRGDIADLEVAMRRLNVRKITYATFHKK